MTGSFVLFDLDGTLADSADGIVAGMLHALTKVGVAPPDEATLRANVGPPLERVFAELGVTGSRVSEAVGHYRDYYLRTGIGQATVYPGMVQTLTSLGRHSTLATATAKRITTAQAFLRRHRLDPYFSLIGGGDEVNIEKSDIVTETWRRLGSPVRRHGVMIGDRHSDIAAGHAVGLHTVAVSWGYGLVEELRAAGPELLVDHPNDLPAAVDAVLGRLGTV